MRQTTDRNGPSTATPTGTLKQGLVFLLVLTSTSMLAAQVSAASDVPDAVTQNQQLGRGVNIIGYDPLWKSPAQGRFQERHFELIKQAGFSRCENSGSQWPATCQPPRNVPAAGRRC